MSGRRERRRRETIEEILQISLDVMAEEGVAALSLAEVARRMGMRTPSLYQYFPSKLAIYDALFERGARELAAIMLGFTREADRDAMAAIRAGTAAATRWWMENPVLAQLMYWRPVPGFEPSPRAFAPAIEQLDLLRQVLRAAAESGQLAPDAATEDGVALFTILMSGVLSQQLSNEPSAPHGEGRFVRLTPTVLEMYFAFYAPERR